TIANGAEPGLEGLQLLRHQDLDGSVPEVSVGPAREGDGVLGADLERFLQAVHDLRITQARLRRGRKTLEQTIQLSGRRRGRQQDDPENGQYARHHGTSPLAHAALRASARL